MKREITFRGKRLDNGKWVIGDLVHVERGALILPIGKGWDQHRVAPETVGQWTGITDANGQRIFEGDIVRWRKFADKEYQISIMKWFEQYAAFGLARSIDDGAIWESDWFGIVFWGGDMEVIGNIHDNPELLKTE